MSKLLTQSAGWRWVRFIAVRAIPATICAVLIVVTLAWNFSYSMTKDVKSAVQGPIRPIVNATMLRQQWNMFSKPNLTESWFVYRAELHDDQVVDVFQRGGPVNMKKPADLSATFTNHRWRKLHVNLCSSRFKRYRRDVADYVARDWNDSHADEQQIRRLDLYQLSEKKDAPLECTQSLCLTIVPVPTLARAQTDSDATEAEVAQALH